MWKKILAVLVVAFLGYSAYSYYTGPFYGAPSLGKNDFRLAFKGEGGLRGIMRGFGEKDRTRKYMAYNAENVPSWYSEAWSICRKFTSDELIAFEQKINLGPGGRADAICEIDADGDVFVRGWIVSVPNL